MNQGKTKPFLEYEYQLKIMMDRGLSVSNPDEAIEILKRTNYYRLSAYSLTLRKDDLFYEDVTFENIYELYCFDAGLRETLLRYCFIVEISFRSYISHFFSFKYGALGYMDSAHFENETRHESFLSDLSKEIRRSDDVFIEHHKTNRNSIFPFWVAIEETTYGMLSKFFKNMLKDDRNEFAHLFIGYSRQYVENWIQCCSFCRNIAAHGGRFYNRDLRSCPVKLSPKVHKGVKNTSPFAYIIAISNLLPNDHYRSSFISEIKALFQKHPFALKKHLGFPDRDWEQMLLP